MKLLIRHIHARGVGKEVNETLFEGSVATIGRGTDQVIAIADRRIPLKHSRITQSASVLQIKAQGAYTFSVNDDFVRQANLAPGDEINLQGHVIRVLDGEAGADFVLEVQLAAAAVERLRDRFTTRVRDVGFPLRSLAWSLSISILLLGLFIPASGLFFGMEPLRNSTVLPDDSIWLSGALHSTHALIGKQCNICHSKPFTPVRDSDCLQCHVNIKHHFNTKLHGRGLARRCAECHQEHNGAPLIMTRQSLCADCHADLAGNGFTHNVVRPVSGFLHQHPSFKVSTEVLSANGKWTPIRRLLADKHLEEHSNLKFAHGVHLAKKGVKSPTGVVHMQCEDCHQPDNSGYGMRTVTMKKDCAGCHQLTFDPTVPNRVVPHGSPPKLMRTLREYYAWAYIQKKAGRQIAAPATQSWRDARVPGRRMQSIADVKPDHEKTANFSAKARDWVNSRVSHTAKDLFEKQTCKVCHEITYHKGDAVPWKVVPVKLTSHWFPLANFSHVAHKNMQCEDCHQASTSHTATDILMPNINSCRACHGGERSKNMLVSTCTTCHVFHLDNQQPMAPATTIRQAKNGMLPDMKQISGK